MLRIVGLTGGIGSGKSVAADMFAQLGVRVVDTDQIAHQLTGDQGKALAAIAEAFGPASIGRDGAMDRARMRQLVFADAAARRRLEAILHPMIFADATESLNEIARDTDYRDGYAVLVVPLLYERMSFRALIWRSLAIDCPLALQSARVQARSALPASDIARTIDAQLPRSVRLQLADDVISNAADHAQLAAAVAACHARYVADRTR